MKNVIVGTAGHIDHGKSRLVKALTGTDPDRLKEEQERGITIDIGFAFLPLGDDLRIGFVDVPGHERFVKNMLAGIGGIDLVLLVVAADESVMPQTREHFHICRMLGVERGLVAVTKIDLADPEMVELVELELRDFLAGSFLEDAPLLRLSSVTGEGIDPFRDALRSEALAVRARAGDSLFRLWVDRAFTIRGFGTVVTGTLLSGSISVGEEVEILPLGKRARVRGVEVHGEKRTQALAGQRTALNLHGVNLEEVTRGHLLGKTGTFVPTSLLDVRVELLEGAGKPLKDGARVRFHLGTDEIMARVTLLDAGGGRELAPGGSAFAQFRLERPTAASPGDRFIIRQYSPVTTVGGGVVLDNLPGRHRRAQQAAVIGRLETMDGGSLPDRLRLLAAEAGVRGLTAPRAAVRCSIHLEEAEAGLRSLIEAGDLVELASNPLTACPAEDYSALRDSLLGSLEAYHADQKLRSGMPKEELRVRVGAGEDTFRRLLGELSGDGRIAVVADEVALAGHQVKLTPEEENIRQSLHDVLSRTPYTPPTLGEALDAVGGDRRTAERIFHLMARDGAVVRVTTDMALTGEAMEAIKSRLRELKASGREEVSVGDVKELFGITRKFAIPLLEFLDRSRFTRRLGDRRRILG